MCDGVKSPGSKMRTNSFTRKHAMKWNGIEGMIPQKGKIPNNFKVRVSNPKGISLKKGFL
jgi:hypothetical protein